jgi:hypothetical protein
MHFAPAPVPLDALRLAFAALLARAAEIGALVVGGRLDYYLHRRLEAKLAPIIAALRIALLHRAFELIPTLRAYKPRPLPEPASIDDAHDDEADEPVPEHESDQDHADEHPPASEPERAAHPTRPMNIKLWPVGRCGHDNSANRQPYYWVPETVCTRRLNGRFDSVARILADINRYARKLARILTRPPRWVRRRPDLATVEHYPAPTPAAAPERKDETPVPLPDPDSS